MRPCEASYAFLEVRGKIKKYVYCSYVKRTGKSESLTGRLWSFGDRERKWNLIERFEKKEPLPDLMKVLGRDSDGNKNVESQAGYKWNKFLRYNAAWQRLEKQHQNLAPHVWRHSYARKSHMKFKLSVPEVAFLMRHSVDIHNLNYSHFLQMTMLRCQ